MTPKTPDLPEFTELDAEAAARIAGRFERIWDAIFAPADPRNLPCPNCGQPNRLTPKDRALDECADEVERGGP